MKYLTINTKSQRLKDHLQILYSKAEKYGFQNNRSENIKDYLVTKDYYQYLRNTSKLMGIRETQRHCLKYIMKIIDKKFKEEIAEYKYSELDETLLLNYLLKRMIVFKEELKNELNKNLHSE